MREKTLLKLNQHFLEMFVLMQDFNKYLEADYDSFRTTKSRQKTLLLVSNVNV